jgi:membrane peptidoglycan carboxypeptidase
LPDMASRALRRRASYRAINDHAKGRSHPLVRALIVVLVAFTMLTSGASAGTIFFYGENLPAVGDFKHRFEFQNTLIQDSQGRLLYDMADLKHGRGSRVVEPLYAPGHPTSYYRKNGEDWLVGDDQRNKGVPLVLQNATIATEDASFYSNPGFDPFSIVRAAYQDVTEGHVVSGASTITQQLVRRYMLDANQQTLSRKTEEIVLAAELTQKYPKSKILWYYLNSVPYGSLPIGAEAAAEIYFHQHVWQLDLAKSALLAGLPEAPSVYDPINDRAAALNRMRYVLHLMYIHGDLKDTRGKPDPTMIASAMKEAEGFHFSPPTTLRKYPQFVQYVVDQLQGIPSLQKKIYNGLRVVTTIDPRLQDQAQSIVKNQIAGLAGYNVTDGALVSLDLHQDCYGCILAMVGSADYNTAAGQINMAVRPRQPGSSFKPFNYIYAFQNGLGPGTTILDAPVAIPDTGNAGDGGWYEPTDYDQQWHGVVSLRVALDNSLNVPAVKVEQFGASVDPSQGLHSIENQAVKMGLSSFRSDNPKCCGWALTLGGVERGVRLVEETSGYGTFATGGVTVPPIAIKQVYDRTTGKLLYNWKQDEPVKPHRVLGANYAYLMTNILSDNASRCTPQVCEFGLNSDLYLGRPAAAKTGTTNAFTDNWTLGYTPDIVTGVWVGNADNSPMIGTTGVTGAAPIWHDYMLKAFQILNLPPKDFVEPPGVYSGSLCQLPGAYTGFSQGIFDIYAGGRVPYCSVGSYQQSTLPVPPAPSTYQPPAAAPQAVNPAPTAVPVQPAPVAPPTTAPAPVQAPATAQGQNLAPAPGNSGTGQTPSQGQGQAPAPGSQGPP